jgi:hypothetical protein
LRVVKEYKEYGGCPQGLQIGAYRPPFSPGIRRLELQEGAWRTESIPLPRQKAKGQKRKAEKRGGESAVASLSLLLRYRRESETVGRPLFWLEAGTVGFPSVQLCLFVFVIALTFSKESPEPFLPSPPFPFFFGQGILLDYLSALAYEDLRFAAGVYFKTSRDR